MDPSRVPELWENDSGEEVELADDITESSVQFISESRRFTFEEDCEILKYIEKNALYNKLKGLSAWKTMADALSNKRTHESLKGRFKTSILAKIDSYCKELKFSQDIIDNFHQIKVEMFPKHLLTPKKCERRSYTAEDDHSKFFLVFLK